LNKRATNKPEATRQELSPGRLGRREGKMKTLAVVLVLAGCLVWVPIAGARDTNREVINREWLSSNPQYATVKTTLTPVAASQAVHTTSDDLPKNYVVRKIR
jgi:hypothetical protein